jgi:beta-mannanase
MSIEEDIVDFANALEAAAVNLKMRIAERHGVKDETKTATISETNFDNLTYKEYESEKLKKFQVADPKDNTGDNFKRAVDFLKQAKATISKRYHGEGYVFSYWLYQGRIYRQKLKQ